MSYPSPTLAALLSFIFPGLGQIYAGETRKGLIWAVPMLLFIVGALFLVLGGSAAITSLITAQKSLALVVLDIAFFLYHVAAMIDAYDIARRERTLGYSRARGAPVFLAILVAITIVIHGLPAVYGLDYYNFASGFQGHSDVIPQASFAAITPGPQTPMPSFSNLPDESIPGETSTATVSQQPGVTGAPGASATPKGSGGPVATVKPKVCPPPPDVSGWTTADGRQPAADGRLNILLVGGDSRSDTGLDTNSLRTDSMLLLSVDIADCKAALFSFPRNMQEVDPTSGSRYPDWFYIPLEDGSHYPGMLNALWRDAASSPAQYPGSDGIGSECQTQFDCERGWRALTASIQQMAGVSVDGVIAVNLKGFVGLINNLGTQCPAAGQRLAVDDASGNPPTCYPGIWLDVPQPLVDLPGPCDYDPTQHCAYYNSQQQQMPINIQPGCYFMDPEYTLAYARSRHQDSDYQRERRQQYVLQSVRKQLDPLSLLPHIPGLLDAVQQNLFMTFTSNDFPYLAQIASRVDAERLYQEDFAPAHLSPLGSMSGMQSFVQNIFSQPEPEPQPPQQQNQCPPH